MHIPDGSVAYLAEEMLNSSASDEQTQNNEEVLAASWISERYIYRGYFPLDLKPCALIQNEAAVSSLEGTSTSLLNASKQEQDEMTPEAHERMFRMAAKMPAEDKKYRCYRGHCTGKVFPSYSSYRVIFLKFA